MSYSADSMAGKRLVILRFSALGDVAMTVPVIYSVAKAYPELEIYVATRPFFARMFINTPANVKVLPFDLKEEYKGFGGTLRIARELAKLKPDYVADLHNMARTMVIANCLRLTGAKVVTVDKARSDRHKVYSGGKPQRQYIDRYFDVFAKLGLPCQPDFVSVFQGETAPATPIPIRKPAVGIAPFARYATKTYPPDNMHEVATMLAESGVNVYLFGGRGEEAATLDKWQRPAEGNRGEIISLAGRHPLEEELAMMSRLDVMVSMDSANQHLASLTGTHVVSVWGSTTPACGFMAFGQSGDNAVSLGLPCQPCTIAGSPECPKGHMNCLIQLSPLKIVDKVMSLLKL